MFRYFVQGKSVDDIVDAAKEPKATPEQVLASIAKERGKFERACLRRVISNAKNGDGDGEIRECV